MDAETTLKTTLMTYMTEKYLNDQQFTQAMILNYNKLKNKYKKIGNILGAKLT